YAPKGIGLLYVRDGAPFTPLLAGGGQEGSLRSGTENMSGIAALGAVLAALEDGQTFRSPAMLASFRDALAGALQQAFPGLVFNAPLAQCLPTTLNFAVPGLSSRLLQDLFDAADVRVSGGSACSAAQAQPSFVLEAMGLPDWQAAGAVRLSIGPAVDDNFIAEACARIRACGESLRRHCMSPADNLPTVGSGITRFVQDGACCYLVADAASQRCLLIDARPEQVERLAQGLRCQGYPLLAVLSSSGEPEHAQARALLAEALPELMPALAGLDAQGWPLGQQALPLGRRSLRRQGQAFLLGDEFGFGQSDPQAAGPRLWAPARDEAQQFASLAALPPAAPVAQLEGAQLQAFIAAHPDALLVDVREPYEQFLSHTPELHGAALTAVPLSRLLNAIPVWLAEQRPLLFFCRSGNRSRQAALAVARLGHGQAWTLAGGLALLPAAEPAADPAFYV
ncbi:MAG: aminotransferase class V-fold PLP-dependent enzyme, partial [Burkholderiaceae bacterium]